MIVLSQAEGQDITNFGRKLFFQYDNYLKSFEDAAQTSVKAIYDEFRQENGESMFALVRIYRLCRTKELAPDMTQDLPANSSDLWMAQMGSYGDEPAWCDRRLSQNHKILPAGDDQSPMLRAAFGQIGLQSHAADNNEMPQFTEISTVTQYFHVMDATDSPHIPSQDGFVHRYGIKSVVGIGSLFASKSLYLSVSFSKVPISREDARKFAQVSIFLSPLLASYDQSGVLWT